MLMPLAVEPDSFVTLHYRIVLPDTGTELFSTFEHRPATLQLGTGQLAEPLERCLLGLGEGEERGFDLAAGGAFGERNGELVQRVARAMIDRHANPAETLEPGDLVEFPAPGGGRYAGVLKSIDGDHALFDFNHPLAGRAVRFEVKIIGILP